MDSEPTLFSDPVFNALIPLAGIVLLVLAVWPKKKAKKE